MILIRKKVFLLMVLFFVSAQDAFGGYYVPKSYNYKSNRLMSVVFELIKKHFHSETYRNELFFLLSGKDRPSKKNFFSEKSKLTDLDETAVKSIKTMLIHANPNAGEQELVILELRACMNVKEYFSFDNEKQVYLEGLADCLYTALTENNQELKESILSQVRKSDETKKHSMGGRSNNR